MLKMSLHVRVKLWKTEEIMKNMKMMTTAILPALLLIAMSAAAYGATAKCTVVEVEDNRLILQCERGSESYQKGDQVKIKSIRVSSQVEGC
jgi:predicted lipoprotein with Yx(FWY)xxD motif